MSIPLKQPHIIKANYRIVTPMFIGDANQKATGISPASVKGALRFWWRALSWGRIRSEEPSDTEALQKLHSEEGALFGTSADEGKAAAFTLRVDTSSLRFRRVKDWPKGGNDSSSYLGIGLWKSGKAQAGNLQPHREYIQENQSFSVTLNFRERPSSSTKEQIKNALLAWGLMGGLGSRSRRAFGSVAIDDLEEESMLFNTVDEYHSKLQMLFSLYRQNNIPLPPFSGFSTDTELSIIGNTSNDARRAHATLGDLFKNYRGQPSSLRGSKKKVFGLPYSGGTKKEGDARRASPLIFHIHPIGKQFTSTQLFLPADFHSDHDLNQVDYSLARNFLTSPDNVILL